MRHNNNHLFALLLLCKVLTRIMKSFVVVSLLLQSLLGIDSFRLNSPASRINFIKKCLLASNVEIVQAYPTASKKGWMRAMRFL